MPRPLPTADRGYGHAHRKERQRWTTQVAAGTIRCARCHNLIRPGQPWDLGHNDQRTAWTGPECRHCNRSAGAAHGNRLRGQIKHSRWHSRPW